MVLCFWVVVVVVGRGIGNGRPTAYACQGGNATRGSFWVAGAGGAVGEGSGV